MHTPGPWEYREIAPYDDGIGYISADDHDIIHAGVSDLPADENRANARLIAAAPDLLAALRNLFDLINADGELYRDESPTGGSGKIDIDAASAAMEHNEQARNAWADTYSAIEKATRAP